MTPTPTSTGRDVRLFALPMLFGNILQSCYAMTDMAVVGRYAGADALAAVSNTAMLSFIASSAALGLTTGGTVLIARFRGAGDAAGQRESARALFLAAGAAGVLFTALTYALCRPALRWMNVPPSALPHALAYMNIVCAGTFFVFGYNAVCAAMRGLGDSRRPLRFIAVAAAVNVALDFLFVAGFGWGVEGAAAATVIAQAASCAAAYAALRQNARYAAVARKMPGERLLRVSPEKMRGLLRLGLPAALHGAALNVSYTAVTALFNQYGVPAAAAAGIGLKVNTFVAMPCWAAGQAVTALAGHAIGAKDFARAARLARSGVAAGLVSTGVLLAGIHVFVRPFLGMFTTDAEVIAPGVLYLRICCSANFIPYCVMYVLNCFAVGVGSPVFTMVNSLTQSVAVRLGLSVALTAWCGYGFTALCVAEAVSPVLPCVAALVFFFRFNKKTRS